MGHKEGGGGGRTAQVKPRGGFLHAKRQVKFYRAAPPIPSTPPHTHTPQAPGCLCASLLPEPGAAPHASPPHQPHLVLPLHLVLPSLVTPENRQARCRKSPGGQGGAPSPRQATSISTRRLPRLAPRGPGAATRRCVVAQWGNKRPFRGPPRHICPRLRARPAPRKQRVFTCAGRRGHDQHNTAGDQGRRGVHRMHTSKSS